MQVKKFGTYFPSWQGKILRFIISLGVSRGKSKRIFQFLWKKFVGNKSVDIYYNGLKLRVNPFGNTIESNILFSSKIREKEELKIIKNFTKPSTLFLDIGANFGYYSLFVAGFGARRCISFEPQPILINRINENRVINNFVDNIDIAPFALGGGAGKVELQIAKSGLGSSAIGRKIESSDSTEVEQKTLNTALHEFKENKVDIIKIDVEGLEDEILYPYLSKLKKEYLPSLIIIEDNAADWNLNIIEWLKETGYEQAGKTRGNVFLVKQEQLDSD